MGSVPAQIPAQRLKAAVADVLKRDVDNPPSNEGILFVGGAAVAGWDLRRSFPQYRTVNRGVPGSSISDAIAFADQLIIPFRPSTIVFYSGETDATTAAGAAKAGQDFTKFLDRIHKTLPKSQIIVLSVKPTSTKPESLQLTQDANEKLKAAAEADKQVRYVDVNDVLINPDGKLALDLFAPDQKLLSADGYSLASQMVRGAIKGAEERYWRGYNPPRGQ